MKTLHSILSVITTILSVIVFYIGAFLIHVYTAYVVYLSYGSFLGIIAFLSPMISEIIIIILSLIFYGLFNEYILIILGYLLCVGLVILLSSITEKVERKITKTKQEDN